ncbi:unnamed protein product [Meganyctiphanes norvegica]|uniref:Uncharacterized protein n=1 Tax=Meganyctiphanes norvegica TaxID=48144 RepID=A0AAV2R2W5_MEGNR
MKNQRLVIHSNSTEQMRLDGEGYPVSPHEVRLNTNGSTRKNYEEHRKNKTHFHCSHSETRTSRIIPAKYLQHIYSPMIENCLTYPKFRIVNGKCIYINKNNTSMSSNFENFHDLHYAFMNDNGKSNFRVPLECPPEYHISEKDAERDKRLHITHWQEFLYGGECIDNKFDLCAKAGLSGIEYYVRDFVPALIIESSLSIVFFFTLFAAMLIYNDVLEILGIFIVLSHLEIHKRALEQNIEIFFAYTAIQNPMLFMMKEYGWCQHCEQAKNKKLTLRLIKKYRNEAKFLKENNNL